MESLQEITEIEARVRRAGEITALLAEDLVPGDIVVLQAGDLVPADLRIVEPSKLQVDESALTGESVPVGKTSEPLDEDVPLAERENMLYKGTYVTRGSVEAVVVSTGPETELGHISASLREAAEERRRYRRNSTTWDRNSFRFSVVATIVFVSGWFRGQDLFLMIETAIALAIATVPQGSPYRRHAGSGSGMWRMADRNALITNLASVETLGSTTVICTDKTGTLTENRMTVDEYELANGAVEVTGTGLETAGTFRHGDRELDEPQDPVVREALEVGVL